MYVVSSLQSPQHGLFSMTDCVIHELDIQQSISFSSKFDFDIKQLHMFNVSSTFSLFPRLSMQYGFFFFPFSISVMVLCNF